MLYHNVQELDLFGVEREHRRVKLDSTIQEMGYIAPPSITVPDRERKVLLYFFAIDHSAYLYMAYFSLLSWIKCTDFENADVVIQVNTDRLRKLAEKVFLPIANNIRIVQDPYIVKLGIFDGVEKYDVINISDADLVVTGEDKTFFETLPEKTDKIYTLGHYRTWGEHYNYRPGKQNKAYCDRQLQIMRDMGYNVEVDMETSWPLGCVYHFPLNKMPGWIDFCRDYEKHYKKIGRSDELGVLFYCLHTGLPWERTWLPCNFGPGFEVSDDVLTLNHIWCGDESEERLNGYRDSVQYLRYLEDSIR